MKKKIVKRRKLKVFSLLIIILILIVISFGIYFFISTPIKNIIIKNTTYLNDDYILNTAGVINYPEFYTLRTSLVEKKLESSTYIKNAEVKRKFYNTLVINITENRPLYINNSDNYIVFENKSKIASSECLDLFRIPRLMNYVPDDKYEMFIKGMSIIKQDILGKISDIEYVPNDYDKDRFLLYMDDGNMVYLTLTKFERINYYNDVLAQLENHKGILYFDSGNHFEIKE